MKSTNRPAGSARRASSSSGRRRPPGAAGAHEAASAAGASPAPRRARPAATPAAWTWLHPAWVAALAAVALHVATLGFQFVRDDHDLIAQNPHLRAAGALGRLLTTDFLIVNGVGANLWRPLVTLSFWLEGRAFAWSPAGFHAVNVVAHALVTALVALIALRLGAARWAALLAGLWFAAMPAHVESVAWISGRTDVFCGLFAGLAWWLDARARAAGARGPGVLAPLAFGLALASKEAALPLLLVFAIGAAIDRREGLTAGARVRWLLPYLGVALVYLVAHQAFSTALAPRIEGAVIARARWAVWTMLPHYVAMLWPGYPHAPDLALRLPLGPADPLVVVGAIAAAVAVATLVVLVAKRSPVAVPVAWFLLPLALTAGLGLLRGHLAFAERLVYVPSMGAAWLLALGLGAAGRASPALGRVAGAAALGLVAWSAGATAALVPDWRDDRAMFRSILAVQPDNVRAQIGYANQVAAQGDAAGALAVLERAERLDPRSAELHASRAVVFFRQGRWPEVLASAERALALDPAMPQAGLLRATALLRLRRLDEAAAAVAAMRRRDPGDPGIDGVHGQILLLRGDPERAIAPLERALAWRDDDASVAFALGVACQITNRPDAAMRAFDRVVRLDPVYYEAWIRLATTAHAAGRTAVRDGALARARALPEAADGRAARLAAEWGVGR